MFNPHLYKGGPVMMCIRSKITSFYSKENGTTFVVCNIVPLSKMANYVGREMVSLTNRSVLGVFLATKSHMFGTDANGLEKDDMCDSMSDLINKSLVDRCIFLATNATAIANKIRTMIYMDEDDEVTYDHVHTLFTQYGAETMLLDKSLGAIASHLEDAEAVQQDVKECRERASARVTETEGGIDFSARISRLKRKITAVDHGLDDDDDMTDKMRKTDDTSSGDSNIVDEFHD